MRLTKTAIARIAATLGLIAFAAGILADGRIDPADIRAIGLASGISSLMWFFVSRGRHSEQLSYQAGYDVGYLDGRRVARPVVIPQDRHLGVVADDPLAGGPSPRRGAAHQLGEQLHVGGAG